MTTKTSSDPTGQRVNRAKASKALESRLETARRETITLFYKVPSRRMVVSQVTYGYDLNPEQAEILNNQIRLLINSALDTGNDTMPIRWWFQKYVELPNRQGELEGLNEFNRLINIADSQGMVGAGGVAPQMIALEVVLSSQQYLEELRNVYIENYQQIKSLSNNTAGQVIGEINRGINAGLTPDEISKSITERYNVAKSYADRIARTEINKAFTDSKMRAVKTASGISGLKGKVRHISALLPKRTRRWHAARHYLVYTVEEQNAWWAKNNNRINCLCHVRTVIIDEKGNYIDDTTIAGPEIPERKPKPKKKKSIPKKPVDLKRKKAEEEIKTVRKATPISDRGLKKIRKSEKPTVVVDQKLDPKESPPRLKLNRKITGEEKVSLEYYKSDGFYKTNQILRNPSKYNEHEVRLANNQRDRLNKVIKKSEMSTDGVLYRGIKDKSIFDNAEKLIGKDIPISTPQSTATNAGSATGWAGLIGSPKKGFYSADPGKSVVFKIRTKKGQHAFNMESLSPGNTGENEFLLGSGGKYKVKEIRYLKDPEGKVTGKVIEVDYNE